MNTTEPSNGAAAQFKIKRSGAGRAAVPKADALVQVELEELDTLLSKRVFAEPERDNGVNAVNAAKAAKAAHAPAAGLTLDEVLRSSLSAKHVKEPRAIWPEGSLGDLLSKRESRDDLLMLSEVLDRSPELSQLKYSVQSNLTAYASTLDADTNIVLNYGALRNYLIAVATVRMGLTEVNGIRNFLQSHGLGVHSVATYAVLSAARGYIHSEHLNVQDFNLDSSSISKDLIAASLPLSASAFSSALKQVINNNLFNHKDEIELDQAAKELHLQLPVSMKPLLVKAIKASPIPVTKDNIKFLLPLLISQVRGPIELPAATPADETDSDRDFEVSYLEDTDTQLQVSASAVKCAAQLYYSMILGDELDVFEVVDWFTHKYLVRGNIEIQDSRLRDDLQMYVFSNRFPDDKTGKLLDRTRPAERQMFYRQVFNYGNAQVTDDVVVNDEFTRLWKVLMLESARYLERAQTSPNPESYVSPQNVMQAVEDLQYNLSTHCTGMASVITPLIYSELNFIIKRIFMHEEVLRQVVPAAGATWWRVVETLYLGVRNARPKSTVLYNKAKQGHAIIKSIAEYSPASFANDTTFSDFISQVDAFITTQSILQEQLTDDLKRSGDGADAYEGDEPGASTPAARLEPSGGPSSNGSSASEWDF
jgi:hypothetical protein